MKYDNICRAVFLDRPNRFVANVAAVHVKNTGRCRELLLPGAEVWLTAPGTPGRKYTYDLVAVRKQNGLLVNMDSQAPNKAAMEWLRGQGYDRVVPEYRYGESRIDFLMERGREKFLMEVKGRRKGISAHPDVCDPDGRDKDGPGEHGGASGVRGCAGGGGGSGSAGRLPALPCGTG